MMGTRERKNVDRLIEQVASGRLDELTPGEVAALEEYLDATPGAAGRLANVVAVPESWIKGATPEPHPNEWDAVWGAIESATTKPAPQRGAFRRVIRFWKPLVAAAACVALLLIWRVGPPAEPSWPVELSHDVVVHELEVFGDDSAFVSYTSPDSGTAVIWVFEEQSG